MRLTNAEIEFLSAWAREEWEADCYRRPAHQIQLEHGVSGALLIGFIKAWTKAEGKKDMDIIEASSNAAPAWPWASSEEFNRRLKELGNTVPNFSDASIP